MAGYDGDWQDRQGGWRGTGRSGPRGRGESSGASGRGSGGQAGSSQPWASRRPRGSRAWSGTQGHGYGVEYKGRGTPYGAGYRPGSEGDFGSAGGAGAGYDFGYQGGELGPAAGGRGWGTRGSYGTPRRRMASDWSRDWAGPYRGEEFNAAYGRDYQYGDVRGRSGAPRAWRRGRGSGYGADYGNVQGGSTGGYASEFRGGDLGDAGGRMGSNDFGGHLHRHYGRTPVDRWPARDAAQAQGRMSDDDVRESVRENLFQDSFVDPDRIDVQVDRGVVTLRGEVDDFLEARYAWDDAWESPGVRGVLNHLTVRTDRASDEMDLPQTKHEGGKE